MIFRLTPAGALDKLSRQIIDAEGHYLGFVKDNQPTLLGDIEAAFAPSVEGAFSPLAATVVGEGSGLCLRRRDRAPS